MERAVVGEVRQRDLDHIHDFILVTEGERVDAGHELVADGGEVIVVEIGSGGTDKDNFVLKLSEVGVAL